MRLPLSCVERQQPWTLRLHRCQPSSKRSNCRTSKSRWSHLCSATDEKYSNRETFPFVANLIGKTDKLYFIVKPLVSNLTMLTNKKNDGYISIPHKLSQEFKQWSFCLTVNFFWQKDVKLDAKVKFKVYHKRAITSEWLIHQCFMIFTLKCGIDRIFHPILCWPVCKLKLTEEANW